MKNEEKNEYIIFRKGEKNDFVRFEDGTVFITDSEDEKNRQLAQVFNLGEHPVCMILDYCHFYNSVNDKINGVRIFAFNKQIGFFSFGNVEEFNEELEFFCKKYARKMKRESKLYWKNQN